MKNDYKVSIITVVYNGAKTIEKTIQSVLNQSYKNIEYIIVDGLSEDGTQEIIEKYRSRIAVFISEKDDGLYDAMNKGIRSATGDIVGIINSDDWYAENAVKKVVNYFEQSQQELVYGRIVYVYPDGRKKLEVKKPLNQIWYSMATPHPTIFIKRSIYEKLGYFDTEYKIAADYDYILKLYSKGVRFGYIDEVIAYFRYGGLSTFRQKEMWSEAEEISMKYIDACPYKKEILPEMERLHQWRCFATAVSSEEGMLCKLLNQYFRKTIKKLIIFGTGIWGKKCYENLKSGGVMQLFFTDNNREKWGTEICGIQVISPERLREMDAYVLIAVKDSGEEIRRQLKNMKNANLKYADMGDLKKLYCDQFDRR